jgi:hypothetical protein
MPSIWKISVNGGALAPIDMLGLSNKHLKLAFESLRPDTLTISDPLAAFDAAPRWAIDTTITLTRNNGSADVAVFAGAVRRQPSFLGAKAERIDYVVQGPWQLLERTPFLQLFSYANTPSSTSTTFSAYPRGIVVLAQADNGAALELSPALVYVLAYAEAAGLAIQVGSIAASLAFAIPLDQATDLSCAEAIHRLLQWTPDAVAWWDYTQTPPAIHIARRGDLTAKTLAVAPAGRNASMAAFAPIESVRLDPREDLLAPCVSIIYVRTDRVDKVSYELRSVDFAGSGNINALGAVVRTIKLTGAITNDTYVTQDLEVTEIPLDGSGNPIFADVAPSAGTILPANAIFTPLASFFSKHLPELLSSSVDGTSAHPGTNVSFLGFRNCVYTPTEGGSIDATQVNYVYGGAITPWMVAEQGITYQDQEVSIEAGIQIKRTVTRADATTATVVENIVQLLKVRIRATNAESGTYTALQSSTYTSPEAQPAGLATAIYAGVSMLHWEGEVVQVEQEPSLGIGLGNTLNLTAGRAAWATMVALVQRIEVDIGQGRTTIKVGWPKQLMPADLAQVWRVNRTRAQVTDQAVRTTGITGDADNPQKMAHKHIPSTGSAHTRPPAVFTVSATPAGTVPAFSDFTSALALVYPAGSATSAALVPVSGDTINFTTSSKVYARGVVTATNPGGTGGNFNGSFPASGVTWYIQIVNTGNYPP